MQLNARAERAAGVAGGIVSFEGKVIATPAGGEQFWRDDDRMIYQVCTPTTCRVEQYHVRTRDKLTLLDHGCEHLAAGGGEWAVWFGGLDPLTRGITTSWGQRFPDAGLGPMGPDGALAIKVAYLSAGPWDIVRPDGSRSRLTDGDAGNITLHAGGLATWTDEHARAHGLGIPVTQPLSYPFYGLQSFRFGGQWWWFYADATGRLITHRMGETTGYLIVDGKGQTFGFDGVVIGNTLAVCWAERADEAPEVQRRASVILTGSQVELFPQTPPPEPLPPIPTPEPPTPTEPPKPVPPPAETFPPLKTTQRYWLHPNIDSDVPGAVMTTDLQGVDVFGLYGQWILDDARWNQIPTLKHLRAQGINLGLEWGVLKPGDYHGEAAQAKLPIGAERVLSKGHVVGYLTMDEPLTGTYQTYDANGKLIQLDAPLIPLEEAAFAIAKFVEKAREAMPGVKVCWAEAWPQIELETMRKCLLILDSWGCRLDGWHLDVDWHRAKKEGLNPFDMIRLAKVYADDYKAPLGVYLVGYPHTLDEDYYNEVVVMAEDLHAEAVWCVDHVLIQSWTARTGTDKQDLPANTGEYGLFNLFQHVKAEIFV
jgi:hypothetical protein